ncbi:MAG TPA: outer membrane beta-barrel protein [Vicinamibacterales bacterium]|nr:outer membrane beta-barrel protein [Vicinamibacterales bacterium]
MFTRSLALGFVSLLAIVGLPASVTAQSVGLGPRFSFVRGHLPSDTPPARLVGGTLRLSGAKHTALEITLDYRATTSEDGHTRVRETPIQGSLLLFPVRRKFSPYLLGGAGIYTRSTDALSDKGLTLSTVQERKMGWHLGMGGEFFVARHAALFADYRYRFVKFGDRDTTSDPINIPGSGTIPGLDRLKLSHQGSMWAGGVAFYF